MSSNIRIHVFVFVRMQLAQGNATLRRKQHGACTRGRERLRRTTRRLAQGKVATVELQLEQWQETELRKQLAKGRRNFSVLTACKRTSLPRQAVLDWVRHNADEVQMKTQEPEEHANGVDGELRKKIGTDEAVRLLRCVDGRRLTSPQLKTLAMLWRQSMHPSWQQLESAWHLTGVPRTVSLKWFRVMRQRLMHIRQQPAAVPARASAASLFANDEDSRSTGKRRAQRKKHTRRRSNRKRGGKRKPQGA